MAATVDIKANALQADWLSHNNVMVVGLPVKEAQGRQPRVLRGPSSGLSESPRRHRLRRRDHWSLSLHTGRRRTFGNMLMASSAIAWRIAAGRLQ